MYSVPTQTFANKVLGAGVLHKALETVLAEVGLANSNLRIHLIETLADGTSHQQDKAKLCETETLCDLKNAALIISAETIELRLQGYKEWLVITTRGNNLSAAQKISDRLPQLLELEKLPSEEQERKQWEEWLEEQKKQLEEQQKQLEETRRARAAAAKALLNRVEALESTVAALTRSERLRCFLSYRFTNEVEVMAAKLERFFALVDVEVITGAGYEPRPIVEKVRAKLGSSLNFVVLLISTHGESMWTRDEIGNAASQGIPVIPLVEEGAKFEPGLFGDLEYISFSAGRIEETFIKLLEAIRFVRVEKSRTPPNKE